MTEVHSGEIQRTIKENSAVLGLKATNRYPSSKGVHHVLNVNLWTLKLLKSQNCQKQSNISTCSEVLPFPAYKKVSRVATPHLTV